MQLTFPVSSRFKTNEVFAPVVFEQSVFATTRSKVIRAAFENGWTLENGYQQSIQEIGGIGGLCFRSADLWHRVNLEFGVKGQITWCCISNPEKRDHLVNSNRYAAVLGEFSSARTVKTAEPAAEDFAAVIERIAAKPVVPNIPAPPKPEVLAYREVACLRQHDHVTLWTLGGSIEVLVTQNFSGVNARPELAYAYAVERHTHARVTIQARAVLNKLYTIRHRWHDDEV